MDIEWRYLMPRATTPSRVLLASAFVRASAVILVSVTTAFSAMPEFRQASELGAHSTATLTAEAHGAPAVIRRAIADTITQLVMKNVDFYVDPEIVLHIRNLRGTMTSKASGPIIFDDKRSFIIHITAATVGLTGKDLGALLNKYVFAYPGAPLKHMSVTTAGTEIVQRGTLHKGVDIPFEITARLDITPQGLIRIHPTRTKILGVNGDALMKALGLSLEKMIDLSKAKGASVHGDDIFLDPGVILPPPTIDGRVTAVRVEGDQIIQVFGTATGLASVAAIVPPHATARSFMYYKGGQLQFGKLIMTDADMQIVSLDSSAATFAFDQDRYKAQLTAGYERITPAMGLEVFMRDVTKLADRHPMQLSLR